MEHVFVPRLLEGETRTAGEIIRDAVAKKAAHGAVYARDNFLVVLAEAPLGAGCRPTVVAKMLPEHAFEGVYVVGPEGGVKDAYAFSVAWLKLAEGHTEAPVFHVRIPKEFNGWSVARAQ